MCAALKPDTADDGQQAIEWGDEGATNIHHRRQLLLEPFWLGYEDIDEEGERFRERMSCKERRGMWMGFDSFGSARHLFWREVGGNAEVWPKPS